MKLVVMFPTQGYGVIVTILDTKTPPMSCDADVVSICCGVPTNATAALADGLHVLFAAGSLGWLRMPDHTQSSLLRAC